MELPPVSDGKRSAASGPVPMTAMPTGPSGAALVGEKTIGPRIAVLVPCHNEEATVAKVVADFRAALPTATVYVYDNASTDRTWELASFALCGLHSRQRDPRSPGNEADAILELSGLAVIAASDESFQGVEVLNAT
jgi:hypothetical protein